MGNVSAASGNSIYVNSSSGNDAYNGLNSTWTGGLNGPKATIKNATSTVNTNGTVHIAQGTYNENNIQINTNMKIIGENQKNTIINGQKSGYSIFKIASGVNLTITNLTLTNGTSNNGGAITNSGTMTVKNSTFINNTASRYGGGAIYNSGTLTVNNSTFTGNTANSGGGTIFNYDSGTLTVENSTFTGNTAVNEGGAIENFGTSIVDNSNFTGNTATNGGAIFNYGSGTLTVENSTFTGNTATNYGGAILNYNGTARVNYNRITRNTASSGSAIYNDVGTVDARYNWWGSNTSPSSYIGGSSVTYDPWIVLTVTTNPVTINVNGKSTITADLLHDSNGVYHDPFNGHVPDGITVNFSSDTKGSVNPTSTFTTNGTVNTTFTGLTKGTSIITTMVDQQTTPTMVTINPISTSMIVISGAGLTGKIVNLIAALVGSDGNPISGVSVQFSVNGTKVGTATTNSKGIATLSYIITQNGGTYSILANYLGNDTYAVSSNTNNLKVTNIPTAKASINGGLYITTKIVSLSMNEDGKIYYTLNGTTPTTSSAKYTGPITISSTKILKYLAVDKVGNKSSIYTQTYTIDKTAPQVSSTTPTNLKTGVSRTSTITIKFSENIKNSTYYNNIKVKNLTTGKYVTITKTISGNTLTIKTSTTRSKYSWYQIIIPKVAIKDYAGNNLQAKYTFKFKTGK